MSSVEILEAVSAAHEALENNDVAEAGRLVTEVEARVSSVSDPEMSRDIRSNLGGVMIDLGSFTSDEEMLTRGTQLVTEALSETPEDERAVAQFYNAANGYMAQWQACASSLRRSGQLDESYIQAKRYFREGLELGRSFPGSMRPGLHAQLLVNYGNCLDSAGRSVEAVAQYDQALQIDPSMGDALGNKGMTLRLLAPLARGHTHLFLIEAHRLLEEALRRPLHRLTAEVFADRYERVKAVLEAHGELEPEEVIASEPLSNFHIFLRDFCVRHQLFLTPATLVGSEQTLIFGDPMFISEMVVPIDDDERFDRYVTFLNQIKQDYVLARYLLIQSQYRCQVVDVMDQDVTLYYPLDYSLHSGYVQMLKTSFRLAVDVLDKIGNFIHDYCNVASIAERNVYFRNLWSTRTSPLTLRSELAGRNNPFVFALFDLALDLRENGYYQFLHDRRNALTHRFLVIHDFLPQRGADGDIPRISLDTFLGECIGIMQIARAAVMYLILFVDLEERQAGTDEYLPGIEGVLLDEVLRWVPPQGE